MTIELNDITLELIFIFIVESLTNVITEKTQNCSIGDNFILKAKNLNQVFDCYLATVTANFDQNIELLFQHNGRTISPSFYEHICWVSQQIFAGSILQRFVLHSTLRRDWW